MHKQHSTSLQGSPQLNLDLTVVPCLLLLFFLQTHQQPQHFDDRVGPLGLCAAVVTALLAILIVSFIDFIEFMASKDNPEPGPSPPVPSPSMVLPNMGLSRMVELASGLQASH